MPNWCAQRFVVTGRTVAEANAFIDDFERAFHASAFPGSSTPYSLPQHPIRIVTLSIGVPMAAAANDFQERQKAVYFGSLDDVRPVELFPEYDWIFVTPEPSHPIALRHWPVGCYGHRFLHGINFFESLVARLPQWVLTDETSERWIFEKARGKLTVYINSAIGGAEEHLTDEAASAIRNARVLYAHGFSPSLRDVIRLCPQIRTLISESNDWARERRLGNIGDYTYVPVRDYDYDRDRGEYIFFDESDSMSEGCVASLLSSRGEPKSIV